MAATLAISLLTFSAAQAQTVAEGVKMIDLEQVQKAEAHFAGLVAKAQTAENYYYLGTAMLLNDKVADARKQFEAGIAKDPNYALNYVGLGAVALDGGNKSEATQQFNKAVITSKSKSAEVFYEIGKSWINYDTKDGVEAIKALKTATTANPKNPDYWLKLGDAYILMGEGSMAADCYENKALPLNRNYAKTYLKIGSLMERARNYNEALSKYKEGIDKEPGYWPAYRELGELYDRARRIKEGFTYYEKYIQNSDRNPVALNKYADFLIKLGSYDQALTVLKEIESKVQNPLIYRGFAYCELETKAYAEGLAHAEQFFAKAEPKSVMGRDLKTYGKLLIASGKDTAKGIEFLKKAVAKDSNEISTIKELSREMNAAKNYKYVIATAGYMDSVGKIDANDYLNLGRAYHNLKMFVEADTVFGKLNQTSPEFASGWYWRAYNAARLDPNSESWRAKPYYEKFASLNVDLEKYKPFLKPTYKYLISYYLIDQYNKEKTHEYADKLLAIDPADSYALDAKKHDFSKPKPKQVKQAAKPAGKK